MGVYRLSKEICFPDPTLADENGLLAVGGDLSPERLILAYLYGIFPWYNPGEEILWWCPKERFLIFPEEIHVSRSMKKFMRKQELSITVNENFRGTMHRCRMQREEREGTWISDEMEEAYEELCRRGYALSIEVRSGGARIGGLYGVSIGKCFFGESMYSQGENGSKVALIALAGLLERNGYRFIDCQFHTDHLESMGGRYVSWEEFDRMLAEGTGREKER